MKRHILVLLGLGALLPASILTASPAAQAQTVNCSGVAAWSGNSVAYAVGALVTYSGSEYKCLQAHTSEAGWDPPAVPALWSLVGTCSTATCGSAPAAPTGLAASNTTSTGTTLSWSAVTPPSNCSISSYTIYKGGASIGTSTSTSFAVTGLTASTTYTFTVAATDAHGTGSQSSALSVTTSSASCTTKPSAPTGLAASNTTSSGTTLSWSAVTPPSNCSISGYTVYQGGTSIATVSSGTSYTVGGLSASTTYSFTVAAVDSAGTGSQSSSVSVTTSAASSGNKHILAGYWDNWGGGVPYVNLNAVPTNWDIILVAFGIPSNNQTGADIEFVPTNETQAQIISDIQQDHGKGQKVILSLGGGNANISLNNSTDVNTFVTDVSNILNTYPFDGIDIDFENQCLFLNSGDTNLKSPTTPVVVNLISALNQLHSKFPKMMLTFAPETFFVQLGYQFYGPGPNGAQDNRSGCQLPVIDATRSWLSYVWTQEYQSGNIEALDNNSYAMGNADFLVAMTEMLLQGFPVANGAGTFAPLAQNQVAVGVGANANAVNGFTSDAVDKQAINYLAVGTSYGGSYKLRGGPYPNLGGLMAWSYSWDNENGNVFGADMGPYIHGIP